MEPAAQPRKANTSVTSATNDAMSENARRIQQLEAELERLRAEQESHKQAQQPQEYAAVDSTSTRERQSAHLTDPHTSPAQVPTERSSHVVLHTSGNTAAGPPPTSTQNTVMGQPIMSNQASRPTTESSQSRFQGGPQLYRYQAPIQQPMHSSSRTPTLAHSLPSQLEVSSAQPAKSGATNLITPAQHRTSSETAVGGVPNIVQDFSTRKTSDFADRPTLSVLTEEQRREYTAFQNRVETWARTSLPNSVFNVGVDGRMLYKAQNGVISSFKRLDDGSVVARTLEDKTYAALQKYSQEGAYQRRASNLSSSPVPLLPPVESKTKMLPNSSQNQRLNDGTSAINLSAQSPIPPVTPSVGSSFQSAPTHQSIPRRTHTLQRPDSHAVNPGLTQQTSVQQPPMQPLSSHYHPVQPTPHNSLTIQPLSSQAQAMQTMPIHSQRKASSYNPQATQNGSHDSLPYPSGSSSVLQTSSFDASSNTYVKQGPASVATPQEYQYRRKNYTNPNLYSHASQLPNSFTQSQSLSKSRIQPQPTSYMQSYSSIAPQQPRHQLHTYYQQRPPIANTTAMTSTQAPLLAASTTGGRTPKHADTSRLAKDILRAFGKTGDHSDIRASKKRVVELNGIPTASPIPTSHLTGPLETLPAPSTTAATHTTLDKSSISLHNPITAGNVASTTSAATLSRGDYALETSVTPATVKTSAASQRASQLPPKPTSVTELPTTSRTIAMSNGKISDTVTNPVSTTSPQFSSPPPMLSRAPSTSAMLERPSSPSIVRQHSPPPTSVTTEEVPLTSAPDKSLRSSSNISSPVTVQIADPLSSVPSRRTPLFLPSPTPPSSASVQPEAISDDDVEILDSTSTPVTIPGESSIPHTNPTIPRSRVYVLVPPAPAWVQKLRRKEKVMAKRQEVTKANKRKVPLYDEDANAPKHDILEQRVADESLAVLRERACEWRDCECILNSGTALIKHLKHHLPVNNLGVYVCLWDNCGRRFTNTVALQTHIENHAWLPFYCAYEECEESFRFLRQYMQHIRDEHNRRDSKRPIPILRTPTNMPSSMPPMPASMPAYMIEPQRVKRPQIPFEQHKILGRWVHKNIAGHRHIRLLEAVLSSSNRPGWHEYDFLNSPSGVAAIHREQKLSRPPILGNLASPQVTLLASSKDQKLWLFNDEDEEQLDHSLYSEGEPSTEGDGEEEDIVEDILILDHEATNDVIESW